MLAALARVVHERLVRFRYPNADGDGYASGLGDRLCPVISHMSVTNGFTLIRASQLGRVHGTIKPSSPSATCCSVKQAEHRTTGPSPWSTARLQILPSDLPSKPSELQLLVCISQRVDI
jgi:hypothetical protein